MRAASVGSACFGTPPSGGQILPKPSAAHLGTMCRCRWKTVCSAARPEDVIKFMPSGANARSIARPTLITAVDRSWTVRASASHRSRWCARGITRVCPAVAGSSGKNASQFSPSHTISTRSSSPRAIAQNGQAPTLSSAEVTNAYRIPIASSMHTAHRRNNSGPRMSSTGPEDPRRSFSSRERVALFLAAGGRCARCGEDLGPGWHADHRRPYSRGGATDTANGQALCATCNLQKGAKDERDADG